MSRAVITLTRPPDNRRNTTKARRPSSVSPNAMYRFRRVRLTLWSPAKTSSTSSGVNSCLSIWKTLSSSYSKPETPTMLSYHVVYTKRYDTRILAGEDEERRDFQTGQVRAGRYGNGVPGRNRRRAGQYPGEAAAHSPGARVRAPGQQRHAAHRRARDRRHQPGPAGGAGAGHVSRRPVLPSQRGSAEYPAPARGQAGYSVSGESFRPEAGARRGLPRGIDHGRGHGETHRLSLAGQRARVGERHRAQPGDVHGHAVGSRRHQTGERAAPAPAERFPFPVGGPEPRRIRAGHHPRGLAPRGRQ